MNKKDLIERIRQQIKAIVSTEDIKLSEVEEVVEAPSVPEVKMTDVKAGEMTISSPDEVLVVGSEVFSKDAEGNNVPLVDGEYILDNGQIIEVVSGKIVEIKAAEAPVEAPVMEELSTEKSAIDILTERISKLEESITKMSKVNEDLGIKLSKIENSPVTEKLVIKPAEFKSVEEKQNAEKPDLNNIRKILKAK